MWQWMSQNSQTLTMLANFGMLAVWLLYLQLFLRGYRRQRRCKILITVGGPARPAARCLITNMSAEAVYIQAIVASVSTGEETWSRSITEYELQDEAHPPGDSRQMTRQGPLRRGDVRDIGSFADLVLRARHAHGDWEPDDHLSEELRSTELMLTVVATYDSEDLLVGAERCFALPAGEAGAEVRPKTPEAQQIRSRRARRRLERHLRESL